MNASQFTTILGSGHEPVEHHVRERGGDLVTFGAAAVGKEEGTARRLGF
jgi:hypothetical protein